MTLPSGIGDTPVLIAGGGPVGLALAVELGLRGIKCLVAEPRLQPTRLRPRAKTLSVRTMEQARRWGLAERLRAAAPLPVSWSQDVSFCTSFLGEEITRFTGVLGLADDGDSPERGQQMPQYVLEEVLRDVVTELPAVDLRLGWRLQTLDAAGPGPVRVKLCDPAGQAVPVAAEYVVGADGARSVVREQIGARYVGSMALRANTGVVFRSQHLVTAMPHRPAVQTWLLNRHTPGMMGPIDRQRKYSTVRLRPSSSGTVGSQPSSSLARPMSGLRRTGSSEGSGRSSIAPSLAVRARIILASSSIVISPGLPRLTGPVTSRGAFISRIRPSTMSSM